MCLILNESLKLRSQTASTQVTISIVAAVQCDPCWRSFISIHLSIQASQESFQERQIQALQSVDERAIHKGKQQLWYWSRLTFGPAIWCFLFKPERKEVPNDGYIKTTFPCYFSGFIHFCMFPTALLKTSTGASRVCVLKATLRVDVEELESVACSPPT